MTGGKEMCVSYDRRLRDKLLRVESSDRIISTTRLNPLRDLHLLPINQVVYLDPYPANLRFVWHTVSQNSNELN